MRNDFFGAWWSTCSPHLKVSRKRRARTPTAIILAAALHEQEAKAIIKIGPID